MALPLVGMLMFACLSAKSDQGQRFLPLATFGARGLLAGCLPQFSRRGLGLQLSLLSAMRVNG